MSLIDETLAALAERSLDEQTVDLVLAALGGEDSLAAALEGRKVARPVHTETASETVEAPGAYLSSIEVEGFRGIGPASKLELEPGPGLTVVVGRNGSGKSSFAEALEVLLTGDSYRWKGKPVEWKQGWRNLHSSEGPSVTARFSVEGEAHPTVMSCVWRRRCQRSQRRLDGGPGARKVTHRLVLSEVCAKRISYGDTVRGV